MLIAVTGMHREARLFPQGCKTIISGGGNAQLAGRIENAIADGASAVISLGIAGGLAPELAVGSVVVATEIVAAGARYDVDATWADALAARIPHAMRGAIVGVDTVVAEPDAKGALHRDTNALAVDMESHVAARVASAYGLPFAALRTVSDAAEDRLPSAVLNAVDDDGHVRLGAVLASVARNPFQVPALIRTGRGSDRAMKQLLRCLDLLGAGLGCPYLG